MGLRRCAGRKWTQVSHGLITSSRFGEIDIVVNSAGFGLFGVCESTPLAKVHEQFEVNVFGVMSVIRAIFPHFRERTQGLILNITSGAGVFALPMLSLYCAGKFAVDVLET